MRIGLITYHFSVNYGAIMQCYATCRALKELGHDVEIINLRQEEKHGIKHVFSLYKDATLVRFMKEHYPNQTLLYHSYEQLKKADFDYDCLLVGSDQVWNPFISKDKCLAYFLDFGPKESLRISYASSLGLEKWPKEYASIKDDVKQALLHFDHISVRESAGQKLLANDFGVHSQLVLDPTMLHENYSEIVDDIPERNDIICYQFNRRKDFRLTAKFISKQIGAPLRTITNVYPIPGFRYSYPPDVENWIKKLAGAKFVITDSFHGLVFSLLYKTPFVVFATPNGKNSRLKNLLELVGLSDRYVVDYNPNELKVILDRPIDYDKVHAILRDERKKSWDFLKNALKNK